MTGSTAERDDRKGGATPVLEWIAAGVGLTIAAVLLGFIGWQALEGPDRRPPDIVARIERAAPVADGWVVEIAVANRSPATAAQVVVAGELRRGDEVVATGEATFDYVPGHSQERGGLFLDEDPATGELRLRALGYARP